MIIILEGTTQTKVFLNPILTFLNTVLSAAEQLPGIPYLLKFRASENIIIFRNKLAS